MLQITPQMRIMLAAKPVDFRKGIDGLACFCRELLKADPFSGTVFIFCSRSAKAVKLLVYDGQGFWLSQKRLSRGRFRWWPQEGKEGGRELEARELQLLLWNGNPAAAGMAPLWKKVT